MGTQCSGWTNNTDDKTKYLWWTCLGDSARSGWCVMVYSNQTTSVDAIAIKKKERRNMSKVIIMWIFPMPCSETPSGNFCSSNLRCVPLSALTSRRYSISLTWAAIGVFYCLFNLCFDSYCDTKTWVFLMVASKHRTLFLYEFRKLPAKW